MIEISQLAGQTKSTPIVLELFFGSVWGKNSTAQGALVSTNSSTKKSAAIYACSNVIDHPEFFDL